MADRAQTEPVTLTDLVDGLEKMGDKYVSAATFSRDVYEVLSLTERIVSLRDKAGRLDQALEEVHPGQYEFECHGRPYTIQVRKQGILELQRGHNRVSFRDKCPYPILSVRDAERLKGYARETYLLLKGPPLLDCESYFCFIYCRGRDGWEAYTGGLASWIKETLWPESRK